MNHRKFGRRQSDVDILHAAAGMVTCERALNHQVDKLLGLLGISRADLKASLAEEKTKTKEENHVQGD